MTGMARGIQLDRATRIHLYRMMVLIRTFEEAIRHEYNKDKAPVWDIAAGLIPGEMHLSAGQEPVAAGICAHLTHRDALIATHRPHHLAIAHGVDLRALAAEIYGREGGLCHGRGGHMHLFDPATHFSCSGIVAEGFPPALGAAFAFRHDGSDQVAVTVTGEGAANQGAFHESLNLASLWQLPVVFVVEDNDWAVSTSRVSSTSVTSNADRAASYGIAGERVDGNDVESVYRAAGRAIASARAGRGPSLIEVHTLRLWGYSEGDAQGYRPDADSTERRDPLPAYERTLRSAGLIDDEAVRDAHDEASRLVSDAITFARNSPMPRPEQAGEYVFA